MTEYIVLKKESIASVKDLEKYEYFIVHAISEFRIYNKTEFKENYTNINEIINLINLYCIAVNEELRYNNGNWVKVKILEPHEKETTGALEVCHLEQKEFIIKETGVDKYPVIVYKYFLKPGMDTSGSADKEIDYLKDIPIIYRHGIAG
jgi:hypothetical protein